MFISMFMHDIVVVMCDNMNHIDELSWDNFHADFLINKKKFPKIFIERVEVTFYLYFRRVGMKSTEALNNNRGNIVYCKNMR